MKTLGLIINPIAGIGGRVGLKGSDEDNIQERAFELGAKPLSINRTIDALYPILNYKKLVKFITYPNKMGETALDVLGFEKEIVGQINPKKTSGEDTKNAARIMAEKKVDLLIFSGGDGTARDIYDSIGTSLICIGIPAGVKIYSAVYTINPYAAGHLLQRYLEGEKLEIRAAEVIDIDEGAYRNGIVVTKLYGYLNILYSSQLIQGGKISSPFSERSNMLEIATYVIDMMEKDTFYILGPGTTVKTITDILGLEKTLIGVDVIFNKKLILMDVGEKELLKLIANYSKGKIIVTPLGGQGFIFGRGNQQISPLVIQSLGRENIWVLSTENKLMSLGGRPLLLDSGDHSLDLSLRGYWKIIIGYNKYMVYPVQ
jgi:predicted polyphosphate/ATP-dependent NAD kinase